MSFLGKLFAIQEPPELAGFHQAAQVGDLAKVKMLLASNPDLVFTKNKKELNATALHGAVMNGHKEVVELLLASGAEVNATIKKQGLTPLHFAVVRRQMDVIKLLLVHEAEINAKDSDGQTPLHVAAANGFKEEAELLLAHGAEVHATTNTGKTPFNYAMHYHHWEIIELLKQNKPVNDVRQS